MAKQKSFLKVAGTLDGLTFYKSVDGHLVRTKACSKSRIMNDPAFIRTRENIAEFGSTAQWGKLLRNAIGTDAEMGERRPHEQSDDGCYE